jgi:hypothetical protein
MLRVERKFDNLFWIWTANDCAMTESQTGLRTWFYFNVTAPSNASYTFSIRNLNNHLKMFREGFRPVVRIGDKPWELIEGKYTYLANGEGNLELTFTQSFDEDETYWFAFTFPWSYTDNEVLVNQL